MYTQPIVGKGKRESEYWFKIKQAWLKVKYDDHYDIISKAEFFRNFSKHCNKCGIEWSYKDKKGNPKIPNPKDYENATKHGYFKKYQWDECFEQYEFDRMTGAEQKARKAYQKSIAKRTIRKLNQISELDDHKDMLMNEQSSGEFANEKRIMQTEKTQSSMIAGIREELELNKQKVELEGNMTNTVFNFTPKSNEEILDEHADTFERFIQRRMRKSDADSN